MQEVSRRNSSAISEGSMPSSSNHNLARRVSSVEDFLYGSQTHLAALRFATLRFSMAKRSKSIAKRVELNEPRAAHVQERILKHMHGREPERDRS